MYTFFVKDSGSDLDIILTRSLLLLAAVAAFLFRTQGEFILSSISVFLLFISAFFIKILIKKFRINKISLLIIAAILLFTATHSLLFGIILLLYGYFAKFLNVKPTVTIGINGILIKKLLSSQLYPWTEFSNIILKDNLLTIDFKTNKLIQLTIEDSDPSIEEKAFNQFCNDFI